MVCLLKTYSERKSSSLRDGNRPMRLRYVQCLLNVAICELCRGVFVGRRIPQRIGPRQACHSMIKLRLVNAINGICKCLSRRWFVYTVRLCVCRRRVILLLVFVRHEDASW